MEVDMALTWSLSSESRYGFRSNRFLHSCYLGTLSKRVVEYQRLFEEPEVIKPGDNGINSFAGIRWLCPTCDDEFS